ncbi:hypothetical protein B6S44_03135 [Bosea sp. Tri-44]|nr:hypothetical protein B6S44_03135 [Bosea sp. Tri-44]
MSCFLEESPPTLERFGRTVKHSTLISTSVTVTAFSKLIGSREAACFREPSQVVMEQAEKRGLSRLLLRWPERRAALRSSLERDPHLAELCEAYETACAASEYWSRSNSALAQQRVAEYRSIIAALEQDIIKSLA